LYLGLKRIVQCHSLREDAFKSLRRGMILRVVDLTCHARVVDHLLLSQREITCILQPGGWDAEESYSDSDEGGSAVEGGGDSFAEGDSAVESNGNGLAQEEDENGVAPEGYESDSGAEGGHADGESDYGAEGGHAKGGESDSRAEGGSAQHANSISECIYGVSTQYAYTHVGVQDANSIRSMRINIWV